MPDLIWTMANDSDVRKEKKRQQQNTHKKEKN